MRKIIPSLISMTRGPFGLLVFWYAIHHQWMIAYFLFIIGSATDALDGLMANKLNAKTAVGGLIDAGNDLLFTLSVLAGLFFTGNIAWGVMYYLAIGGYIVGVPLFLGKRTNRWHVAAEGLSAFYYLAVLIYCFVLYTKNTTSPVVWIISALLLIPVSSFVILIKKHRWMYWIGQITGQVKEGQFD